MFEGKSHVLKIYVKKNNGPPLIGRNGVILVNLGICKIGSSVNN